MRRCLLDDGTVRVASDVSSSALERSSQTSFSVFASYVCRLFCSLRLVCAIKSRSAGNNAGGSVNREATINLSAPRFLPSVYISVAECLPKKMVYI